MHLETFSVYPYFAIHLSWKSLNSGAFYGFMFCYVFYSKFRGNIYDENVPSLLHFLFYFVCINLVEDFYFYVTHRLLHTKLLYQKIHKVHHQVSSRRFLTRDLFFISGPNRQQYLYFICIQLNLFRRFWSIFILAIG